MFHFPPAQTANRAGRLRRALLAAALCVVMPAMTVHAQEETAPEPIDPDKVVGTVGGVEITERDIDYTLTDLDSQLSQVPAGQRRFAALMALIDIKVLAEKADEDGVDDGDMFKRRLAFLRDRTLHNFYFESEVANQVTDADVRARYDQEIAATPAQNETRARHILVETEETAKDLIAQLDGGADFETLAKENSTGPSAPNGGDLGYFGPGQMVPEFDQAASALDVGAVSPEPVKTQFGWHVIKVEDRRPVQPPAFEQVESQVRSLVLREKYFEIMQDLRENAEVELVDPALKEAYDAARAEQGSQGQN